MLLYYLLIFVIPLEHHPIWASYFGDLTIIKYVGGACLLYAMVHFFMRDRAPSLFAARPARWFFLFMGMAIVGYLRVGNFLEVQQSPLFNCISFILFFFITLTVVDSISRLRWVLLTAVGSVAFGSLYAIRDWQKYHGMYAGYRPSSVVGDPNYFALTAMFTIPLGIYLAFERSAKLQSYFCLGSVVVTSVAVTLGASRGAFFGMVGMFLMIALRSRRRALYLSVAGAIFLLPSLFFANSPLRRVFAPSDRDQMNIGTRTTVWKAGLRMIRDHPLFGIGVGAFKPMVTRFEEPGEEEVRNIAHNTYIEVAAEMGLPGLLVFLVLYASTFRMLEHMRKRAGQTSLMGRVTTAFQAGFVGAGVCAFFISAEFQKFPWFFLFLAMSMQALAHGRRRRSHIPRVTGSVPAPAAEGAVPA